VVPWWWKAFNEREFEEKGEARGKVAMKRRVHRDSSCQQGEGKQIGLDLLVVMTVTMIIALRALAR
jgi:hypothetical protein